MTSRPPGDKPLSEPMMVSLQTRVCVTWPQWVKLMPHGMDQFLRHISSNEKLLLIWVGNLFIIWHIETETKCLTFRRRHFQTNFYFNENVCISIKISLKFVPKCPINNIPALVQIMATNHYLDQCCLVYRRIYASLGLNELTKFCW